MPLSSVKSRLAGVGLRFMDEPTNDLDTETLAILEDYLDNLAFVPVPQMRKQVVLVQAIREPKNQTLAKHGDIKRKLNLHLRNKGNTKLLSPTLKSWSGFFSI